MSKPCVLVIDDEPRYRDLIELNLTRRGYRVLLAADGVAGLNLLQRDAPDLVILDLMLPGLDGYEVCRRVRQYSAVPIIMLTAKAEESHKVLGLRLGADDYITKPFGAEELLARVEAVLRRAQQWASVVEPEPFVSGDLVIDLARHRVTRGGREVVLSPGEYRLLQVLVRNAGRVLVHEALLRQVWGPGYADETQLLHTAIRRLRRKLEDDPSRPRHILARRGIGYWLARPGTS